MLPSIDNNKPATIGLKLALCTLLFMSCLGIVHFATKNTITEALQQKQSRQLADILAETQYDNEPGNDSITVVNSLLGDSNAHTVWRARIQDAPVAIVLEVSAPLGYNGPIKLLVGISVDGLVTGVRVVEHRETPGLGDAIELARSDWVRRFENQSLTATPAEKWRVKRDGGDFDQFTGATITPRAIVTAVHNALVFYTQNQEVLFE